MRTCLIILFIAGLLILSGCGGTVKMTPPGQTSSPGQSSPAYSDAELLQRAEVKERNFMFSGKCEPECECNEECMGVTAAYQEVIESAADPTVKTEAQQKLAEFLFRLRHYILSVEVAGHMMDSAPNDDYRCNAMILMAQGTRKLEMYEASFDSFHNARQYCGEDKEAFLKDNMCNLLDQSGQRDQAELLCPEKYS
jgi:hypothetical protein